MIFLGLRNILTLIIKSNNNEIEIGIKFCKYTFTQWFFFRGQSFDETPDKHNARFRNDFWKLFCKTSQKRFFIVYRDLHWPYGNWKSIWILEWFIYQNCSCQRSKSENRFYLTTFRKRFDKIGSLLLDQLNLQF